MKRLTLMACLLLVPLPLGACAPAAQTGASAGTTRRSAVPNAITTLSISLSSFSFTERSE
ncbi:hypothetical protein [Deinococcus sp.]|uniref:hypothetical protein n=1 Tax=Deinococcus sp. TaxID=47478 RepID=UPI0025F3B94C|nr:hypothetical protein [Deinococcus sp.]